MKLRAPKVITFWIAVVLAVLGLLGFLVPTIPVISGLAFWLVAAGFVLLMLGNLLDGL